MDRPEAIAQVRDAAREIVKQLMRINPALRQLGDVSAQEDCLKAVHALTVELEVLKKRIGKLEREDASTVL
jgi:hypothetical protein